MTVGRPSPDAEAARASGLALADALLESSRSLAPLPEAAHARVKRRLKANLRRSVTRRPRWLQPVLASGVMLLCGAAFGIALDRLVLQRPSLIFPDSSSPSPPAPQSRRDKARTPASSNAGTRSAQTPADLPGLTAAPAQASVTPVVADPAAVQRPRVAAASGSPSPNRGESGLPRLALRTEPARPTLTPAPAELPLAPAPAPAVATPAVVPAESVAEPAKVVAQPVPDGLSEERLLAAAVRALRAQRDAPSALLALDEYLARFPRGRLAVEADVLRVDALVALRRDREALVTLDRMELVHMPGGLERQLQRGELRASAGRWEDAQADFGYVLAGGRRHADLSERALAGRARCRLGAGDEGGARADANEYLRRFPQGRFAGQLRRLVANPAGSP